MSKELLVAAVTAAGLAGLISVMAAGLSNVGRLDAPMCKVAGTVIECVNTDFSRHPPRPILH